MLQISNLTKNKMSNKRKNKIKRNKALNTQLSGRGTGELSTINEENNMNRNYNNDGRGFNSQAVVTIVNEEFAKNATPDVTKAAILARLNDGCIDGNGTSVLSFSTQALKDAAIKADAASPVSAQHTADVAGARVTA